jgi:hypothetical protein
MDRTGVAVGLATISAVGAALLFQPNMSVTDRWILLNVIWALRLMVATVQWKFWYLLRLWRLWLWGRFG